MNHVLVNSTVPSVDLTEIMNYVNVQFIGSFVVGLERPVCICTKSLRVSFLLFKYTASSAILILLHVIQIA